MFFSSIAHELRTPLNSIIPMSMSLSKLIKEAKQKQYIQIILNASQHLLSIIEDALDMTRIENNKFEVNLGWFNIRETIHEVKEIMNFQILSKKLNLEVDIEEIVPKFILQDNKRYKQILFNLLGNAIKFTFKGLITLHIDFQDGNLVTKVKDTGIGMKDTELNNLF